MFAYNKSYTIDWVDFLRIEKAKWRALSNLKNLVQEQRPSELPQSESEVPRGQMLPLGPMISWLVGRKSLLVAWFLLSQ